MAKKYTFPEENCWSCQFYKKVGSLASETRYCCGFKRRKPRRFTSSDPSFKAPKCPIFGSMGLEMGVEYVQNPVEIYAVFPIIVLAATVISAFLTSLYTGKIKSSDTASIE